MTKQPKQAKYVRRTLTPAFVSKPAKLFGLTLSAAIVAACTGGEVTESSSSQTQNTSSSVAISSATPMSSSAPQVSSSAATSSSTPAQAGKTNFADFQADAVRGADIYAQQCEACHGVEGNAQGVQTPIDVDKYPTAAYLHRFTEDYMPKTPLDPGSVVGQDAADVAAYMETWRETAVAACSAEEPVTYAERSLKMLTESEYRNSVQDLFPTANVPSDFLGTLPDIKIGKFPNHQDAVMIAGRARQFMTNAENIADWAIENGLAPNCADATACANAFINDFAYRAFRRPLTTGGTAETNEAAQIRELFAQAPNATAGIRWAYIATLTSPNFLYRSEMGIKVSEALANGWNTGAAGSTNVGDYEADGAGTTVNGANLSTKGSGENIEGFGYNMYTNGTSSHSFNFPDPALLSITVKANDMDMMWPLMELSVGQELIASESVETYDAVTYTYLVTGQTGNQQLSIRFNNDAGREPYGTPGNDIDLHIGDITVVAAKPKEAGEPEQSVLELADPNAYVLDPFEYAAALSYMYTGSTPDAQLMAAAASGAINDPAVVEQHIDRLLASPAAERHVKEFAETWMRIDHMYAPGFTRVGNGFNDTIRAAMVEELRTTFWNVFDNEDVPYSEFFDADYIFANKTLADFYGVPNNAGNSFTKINTTERGGVTTMGAFLVNWAHQNESAPVLRGVNVRELMLCHHIAPPPSTNIEEREQLQETVDALLANGDMTTRKYYGLITEHPECNSCHEYDINPLGFGLEDFNQVGLPRTFQLDLGGNNVELPIDSSGTLFGTEIYKDHGDSEAFNGAKALGKILAGKDAVQACLSEKFFRQAVGRPVKNGAVDQLVSERELAGFEKTSYACAHETLNNALKDNNQSPKAMFKTLGTLDLIRFRR